MVSDADSYQQILDEYNKLSQNKKNDEQGPFVENLLKFQNNPNSTVQLGGQGNVDISNLFGQPDIEHINRSSTALSPLKLPPEQDATYSQQLDNRDEFEKQSDEKEIKQAQDEWTKDQENRQPSSVDLPEIPINIPVKENLYEQLKEIAIPKRQKSKPIDKKIKTAPYQEMTPEEQAADVEKTIYEGKDIRTPGDVAEEIIKQRTLPKQVDYDAIPTPQILDSEIAQLNSKIPKTIEQASGDTTVKTGVVPEENQPLKSAIQKASTELTVPSTKEIATIPTKDEAIPNLFDLVKEKPKSDIEQLMDEYRQYEDQLKQAMDQRNKNQTIQGLISGLAQIGSGLAYQNTRQAPPQFDASRFNFIGQRGEQAVQDVLAQRGLAKERVSTKLALEKGQRESELEKMTIATKSADLELDKQTNDPNSDISKVARYAVLKKIPQLKGQVENLSAKQLKEAGLDKYFVKEIDPMMQLIRLQTLQMNKDKLDLAKQAEERKQKQFDFRTSNDLQKDRVDAQKQVKQDPRFKMAKEAKFAFSNVEPMIEAAERGDATALKSLGPVLAKALGERGVLTDQDVKRYIQNSDVLGRLHSDLMALSEAKMTPEVAKSIRNLTATFKSTVGNMENELYNETAALYQQAQAGQGRTVTFDEALGVVNPYVALRKAQESGDKTAPKIMKESPKSISPQDQEALEWLKTHSDDPQAPQVKAKLQAKGVL